jgi:beta-1,4-N-acetylglucosaminyltransferase
MIFVTIGTTDFDQLVEKMDALAPSLTEQVIIQTGKSKYVPKNCEYFRFAPSLAPYIDQADIVVSQGGMAVTYEVLNKRKKLISVENTTYTDGHQKDILKILAKENYLVWCSDLDELPGMLDVVKDVELKPYIRPPCTIAEEIRNFLNTLEVR